ncbi:MAG TPA: hypothetical protein VF998_10880 [Candidatus Limnocylindria bacterium]
MARYDENPVPPGNSHRWEVVLADEEDEERPGPALTALDVRGEHRVLAGLSDEQLGEIRLVPEGRPLARYHMYLDLHDPARADFAAEGSEVVKPGQRIVARDGTHPDVWEALRLACEAAVGRRR